MKMQRFPFIFYETPIVQLQQLLMQPELTVTADFYGTEKWVWLNFLATTQSTDWTQHTRLFKVRQWKPQNQLKIMSQSLSVQ